MSPTLAPTWYYLVILSAWIKVLQLLNIKGNPFALLKIILTISETQKQLQKEDKVLCALLKSRYNQFSFRMGVWGAQSPSPIWLFVTPWTIDRQASLSLGFSWQEYWNELPPPSPGCLRGPGTQPLAPILAGRFVTNVPPGAGVAPSLSEIQAASSSLFLPP